MSFEAEAATLTSTRTFSCQPCSGERKVGYIGDGTGIVQFDNVLVSAATLVKVEIQYVNGDTTARTLQLTVNDGGVRTVTFPSSGGWNSPASLTITVTLSAGSNSLRFFNDLVYGADLDKIRIAVA